jgi:glycosyltransferase involved in cell wall biosynthesis
MRVIKTVKVAHIITGLDTGGAEMMLYKILKQNSDSHKYEFIVISLLKPGNIGKKIQDLKVPLKTLNLSPGSFPSINSLFQMFRILGDFKPSIIQGWMYHGNLFSALSKFRFPRVRVIFNIRQTLYSIKHEKVSTALVIILNMLLSRLIHKTVYNSHLSKDQHIAIGYSKGNAMVIGNGFDLDIFKPDPFEKIKIRDELKIQNDEFLVTHISRFHPMKDHTTLLKSINLAIKSNKKVKFLLVGKGLNNNKKLEEQSQNLGLNDNIIFLGEKSNISNILAATDLTVLTSAWGEGFPNVLGESLASGVLCVSTDVGDAKFIVNEYGFIANPGSYEQISSAILKVLSMSDRQRLVLGEKARKYIKKNYSIDKVYNEYLNIYREN